MGIEVKIIQEVDDEKFKNRMTDELRKFHSEGIKTDVKFSTYQLNVDSDGTMYTAMIIASKN